METLRERILAAVDEVTFLERAKAHRPPGQWFRMDEQMLEQARGHLEALIDEVGGDGEGGAGGANGGAAAAW